MPESVEQILSGMDSDELLKVAEVLEIRRLEKVAADSYTQLGAQLYESMGKEAAVGILKTLGTAIVRAGKQAKQYGQVVGGAAKRGYGQKSGGGVVGAVKAGGRQAKKSFTAKKYTSARRGLYGVAGVGVASSVSD